MYILDNMKKEITYNVLNWEEAFSKSHKLFELIFMDNFIPDIVVAVARGGWIPGRLIADFFRTKKTANIKVDAYHEISEENIEPEITQSISMDLSDKKVLIVDDIADSGKSLEVVIKSLENVKEIKTATIHYKKRSIIVPDYYVDETASWIIYPWEYYETIEEFTKNFHEDGMTLMEIRKELMSIGFPVNMIDSYLIHYPLNT